MNLGAGLVSGLVQAASGGDVTFSWFCDAHVGAGRATLFRLPWPASYKVGYRLISHRYRRDLHISSTGSVSFARVSGEPVIHRQIVQESWRTPWFGSVVSSPLQA